MLTAPTSITLCFSNALSRQGLCQAYEYSELWDMPLVPFIVRGLSKYFRCRG